MKQSGAFPAFQHVRYVMIIMKTLGDSPSVKLIPMYGQYFKYKCNNVREDTDVYNSETSSVCREKLPKWMENNWQAYVERVKCKNN